MDDYKFDQDSDDESKFVINEHDDIKIKIIK